MITVRSGPQPADFADVRATNLAVVFRYVRAHAPCSRADIAAGTGLNKATVSSLIADLLDRRLVRETGLVEHRIGRPATNIVLDGATYAAVGVEVDGDHLSVEAVDLAGAPVLSWRRAFPGLTATPSRAVSSIVSLTRKALTRIGDDGRQVLGLTVGVPGLVGANGLVTDAANLGWHDVDLRGDLRRALPDPALTIAVENDATLCALAEYRYGGHAGIENLVYLGGEVGVGAGIIIEGRPLRGSLGYAGEIGHLPVDPYGPACACGRIGCLEAVAGIPALIRRLDPETGPDAPATDFEPEVARIAERASAGDPATLAALAEVGRHLGWALSILANLVNPEVATLGGYYARLGRWLLPPAEAEMRARAVAPDAGGCRLLASTLGHGAAALGGTARILAAVDAGELPRPAHSSQPSSRSIGVS